MVKTDYFSNFASILLKHVNDFEVFDNYMFATNAVSTSHSFAIMLLVFLFQYIGVAIKFFFLLVLESPKKFVQ